MAVAPVASADDSNDVVVGRGWGEPASVEKPVAGPTPLPWFDNTNAIWLEPDYSKLIAGDSNTFGWDELSSATGIAGGWDASDGVVGQFSQIFTVPSTDADFPYGWPIGLGVQYHIKSLSDHQLTVQCQHGDSTRCFWQPKPDPLGGGAKDSGTNGGAHGSAGEADTE
jgi:hypothetical protein